MKLRDITDLTCQLAWNGPPPASTFLPSEKWFIEHRSQMQAIFRLNLNRLGSPQTPASLVADLAEEVLVWELHNRVVAASLALSTSRSGSANCVNYGHNLVVRSVTVREQIRLALSQFDRSRSESLRVERLKRRIDRWADLLLSPFADSPEAIRFATDEQRCREFANDRSFGQMATGCAVTQVMQSTSLRRTIPNRSIDGNRKCLMSRRILSLGLSLLPQGAFDRSGMLLTRTQRQVNSGLEGGVHLKPQRSIQNAVFDSPVKKEVPAKR